MPYRGRENKTKIAIAISVLDNATAVTPGSWLHVNGSEFVSAAGCVIPVVGTEDDPALGVVVKVIRPDPTSRFTRVLLQTRGEVLLPDGNTPLGWRKKVLDAHYVLEHAPPTMDTAPNVAADDLPALARIPASEAPQHLQLVTVRRWPLRF